MKLNSQQMADWYKSEGGPDKRVVQWLSVALAESSWETDVVSPTGATGLYQIEPYSWPAQLGPYSLVTDPGYNTLAMLDLSGGGMNFAPWDTAYANINSSGRYTYLAWPETGSAAYNNFVFVATALGTSIGQGVPPPPRPGIDGTVPDGIAWYGQAAGVVIPQLVSGARRVHSIARRSY